MFFLRSSSHSSHFFQHLNCVNTVSDWTDNLGFDVTKLVQQVLESTGFDRRSEAGLGIQEMLGVEH